jgi:hypothetical protein
VYSCGIFAIVRANCQYLPRAPPLEVPVRDGPPEHPIVGPPAVLARVLRPLRPGPPVELGVGEGLAVVEKLRDCLPGVLFPPRGEHHPKRAGALRCVFVVEQGKGFASVPLADVFQRVPDLRYALAVEVAGAS